MIEIREVKTKKQLKLWVDFPNKLFKNDPNYVPFLMADEMSTFTRDENPAHSYCDTKLFLACRDNKVVGRICGLINHSYNKKWNQSAIRFTRFDFIDDFEVSSALFNKVVQWAKENNLSTIMGPIGFHDFDHEGMLVDGFNEMNLSITFFNQPYYLEHMEKLGLKKDADWVEYQVSIPKEVDPKLKKVANFLEKRNGYRVETYTNRKKLFKDAYECFRLIDRSFAKLYGTVPLTEEVIDKAIKDNVPLLNLKYAISIKDKNDEIVGFALMVPSIAKALKKSNGRIFPFGIFRMLKALKGKNDTLEMYFVAVKPELQKQGIPALIMSHLLQVCIDNGVKKCETGPELETNGDVQSMWKTFDARQHRRRRCYTKQI